MPRSCAAALLLLFFVPGIDAALHAQSAQGTIPFSRKNNFGIFGEYSNDSSHILLGESEQRKLLNFGISYSRNLASSRVIDFQYLLEIRPVIIESDPLTHQNATVTINIPGEPSSTDTQQQNFAPVQACQPNTTSYKGKITGPTPGTFVETITDTCGGRKWTFGEGMSPVGIKLNFRPHHQLQPVFSALGGYMFSTEPIPIAHAGSFNFTFEFGAGVEFYRSREPSSSLFGNRSLRAEYRYHHISNHDTADYNPGIDSGMLQVTYAFGK